MRQRLYRLVAFLFLAALVSGQRPDSGRADRAHPTPAQGHGERMLAAYFQQQVDQIAAQSFAGIQTLEDWTVRRATLHRQLLEMLGLWPLPPRGDLRATITGQLDHDDFVVEKLYFQSLPGLYVTANLYRPKSVSKPLPAVLYVCGHGNIKKDGVSYGSKTSYQHHPAWFARHGYVSLVLDTLQLGEIEGLHHGVSRQGMWWWLARGYTPAGVETWNAMRALDYLQTRPEVDAQRLGVTGRSGGGAYSWFLAALDERIQAAVPVAGITDLQNHVVDGAIEGHCDCMYMVNTYRWDFPVLAALVAPRPLLLGNSDKDTIFPLDGVLRVHRALRRIYNLYGAADRLGLLITEGPHKDTQDLQVPAFRWMNRWLKGEDPLVERPAVPFFAPESLRVFTKLPEDQQNTRIHEHFVPAALPPAVPADAAAWRTLRRQWLEQLQQSSFRGWPSGDEDLETRQRLELTAQGLRLSVYDFNSHAGGPLRLWLLADAAGAKAGAVWLHALDASEWEAWAGAVASVFPDQARDIIGPGAESLPTPSPRPESWETLRRRVTQEHRALAVVAVRGIGPTAWPAQRDVHIRRRFALVGQTLESMRVWDVRRALATLHRLPELAGATLGLQGQGPMAGVALYAALFEPEVAQLELWDLPATHRDGPVFLNVLKLFDMPQALAMALTDRPVVLHHAQPEDWAWARTLATRLKLPATVLQFHTAPDAGR